MVPKKDENANIIEQIPEALPSSADLSCIERTGMVFSHLDLADTGSDKLFDDYKIGEVLNHSSGITIDETDPTAISTILEKK